MSNENQPSPDQQHIIDAIKRLHASEKMAANELTRRRHLSHLRKALHTEGRRRNLVASAAAAILVIGAGVVITNTRSSDSPASRGVRNAAIPALKPVDFISAVPFDRAEDYVMISVDSDKADRVGTELSTVMGTSASVVGVNTDSTTFVVPASVARQLSDTSGLTVVADTPMKLVAEQTPTPSWGLDRIDAVDIALNNSYKYVSTGASSFIYVIDTGVYSAHTDLSGRVISGYTAVDDGNGTNDCNGHGTHVAGTAAGTKYGVAKSATVVAVRVLDCSGSGYSSSVVAGINWAIASHPGGPGVINLSLGGGANSAVDTAVANATAAGLVVVVAAGNSSTDACQSSPARAASALTIGATDQSDARASYSNFGSCVDMYAPGTSITSAWISGSTASRALSGTSMASPHVAGLAARLQQAQPGITSSGVAETLTAKNVGGGAVTIANFVEDEVPVTTTTTPDTTVPVETSTTVAPAPTTTTTTTTVKARPGNSGSTPGNSKAPGQNKNVIQPKEFAMGYETVDEVATLVASWIDDRTPETYAIECAPQKTQPDAEPTTRFMVEKAATTVADNGRTRTSLSLTPTESVRCWVVAFIGTNKSAQSNPAIVQARAKAPRSGTPESTTTTTLTSTTTVASNRSGNTPATGNSNKGNTQSNKGR